MTKPSDINLTSDFTKPDQGKPKRRKRVPSISIRVTEEEKARLQEMAGAMAVSGFIRQTLLGDDVAKRPRRYIKKQRKPDIDHTEIARLLGMFGQSELGRSMLALSLAEQTGDLDVTPEVSYKLEQACDDIHEIKVALIMALGIKPQGERK